MSIQFEIHRKFPFYVRIFTCVLIAVSVLSNPVLAATNPKKPFVSLQNARTLLEKMSVEERVGQLFMLGFNGAELTPDNPINDLVVKYRIGGVMLRRDNDNFLSEPDTVDGLRSLVTGLQKAALMVPDSESDLNNGSENLAIPLFIGISQNGDSFPNDQILSGLTPLPSQMAIGATWDTSLASKGGEILGRELKNLGINMLFGPSLDVLEIIYIEGGDDLGTRPFGGDPFWVGQMGQAFISGVHAGSGSQVAVIAKNFPGRGSSDRSPESGLATVRKSLDQLKLVELSPFFVVTSEPVGSLNTSDGMLISHIRYQGLQGNIRSITKPITFDQGALSLLMGIAPLSDWRASGGILVSDDLGSQAVRNHFSPGGQSFDARQVVRNAFQAGSDLLYMNQLVSSGDKDWVETFEKTLELFIQKYREDRAFADRVDVSAERILALKLRMYGDFSEESVLIKTNTLQPLTDDFSYSFDVSQKAVTLISPTQLEIMTILNQPPEMGDRMVFITDTIDTSQCSSCPSYPIIEADSLPKIVLRLYGPNGSGQISSSQVKYYSYSELIGLLDNSLRNLEMENDLSRAQWIIFSSLNISSERSESLALKRFLSERNALIRDKKVIVFGFNAPYYLDATDISSVTAYYCLFSKNSYFLETAARVLFQEITPVGSSPVSIPGIAYDLNTAMNPDPRQILTLEVDTSKIEGVASTEQPVFQIGDAIPLKTGIILDQNGHPVPDGTVVRFSFTISGDRVVNEQVETLTQNGIAQTTYRLQLPGVLEIRVSSDIAQESQVLTLDISGGKSGVITSFIPTSIPTEDAQNATSIIEPKDGANTSSTAGYVFEWFLGTITAWLGGVAVYFGTKRFDRSINHLRLALGAVIGGLSVLVWILIAIPGPMKDAGTAGLFGLIFLVIAGNSIGLFLTWQIGRVEKHKSFRS